MKPEWIEIYGTILKVCSEYFEFGGGYFNKRTILTEVCKRMNIEDKESICFVMNIFDSDIFGKYVLPGTSLYFDSLPNLHLTELGKKVFKKRYLHPDSE